MVTALTVKNMFIKEGRENVGWREVSSRHGEH